jgi:hypothetical protein
MVQRRSPPQLCGMADHHLLGSKAVLGLARAKALRMRELVRRRTHREVIDGSSCTN